jgi:hypothetical protein
MRLAKLVRTEIGLTEEEGAIMATGRMTGARAVIVQLLRK